VRALLDTNILVDYLNGIEASREEMDRYGGVLISPISWMEVMIGAESAEEDAVRAFLSRFVQVPVDRAVAEGAVAIRREHRIRLPDAIVWAGARRENALLVTRNTKDFPTEAPDVRIPYRL
jgi:hypothetical protein